MPSGLVDLQWMITIARLGGHWGLAQALEQIAREQYGPGPADRRSS